ncbi:MAG: DUF2301 domain-containing membrane protein [Oculatellaceae cyanobacterium Prado106]|jgi:uncharacterized integral membrane protein|nr:DUF2301 domain-containing membrane protein [Oculatellaceae cyanobacterium Prado106]
MVAESFNSPDDSPETRVYQGQFGEFTIEPSDRQGVILYRSGLMLSALSFALGCTLVLWQGHQPGVRSLLSLLYSLFCLGLATSLLTIHIYLVPLHRVLQVFWGIGAIAALVVAHAYPEPFAVTVYQHPLTILGVGFTFAALTGIFFKEAFCFNRLETKALTFLVPALLLGHLLGILPTRGEQMMLAAWAILFVVFALRKAFQEIPADIGDKSVFAYLKQQKTASRPA